MIKKFNLSPNAEEKAESAILKLQHTLFSAKQQFIEQFKRKQDSHVVACDAEVDAKLELFKTVRSTSFALRKICEKYCYCFNILSVHESEMSCVLKGYADKNSSPIGRFLSMVSCVQGLSATERLVLRKPLNRLHNEIHTFHNKAIADTLRTINQMESARSEYRASLLWMKQVSEGLDPDAVVRMERFRKVQSHVKVCKLKFDRKKSDVIQKIDLLRASRCNMFSNVLSHYRNALLQYWVSVIAKFNAVLDNLDDSSSSHFNDAVALKSVIFEKTNTETKPTEKDSICNKSDDNLLIDLNDQSDDTGTDYAAFISKSVDGDDEDHELLDLRDLDDLFSNVDAEPKECFESLFEEENDSFMEASAPLQFPDSAYSPSEKKYSQFLPSRFIYSNNSNDFTSHISNPSTSDSSSANRPNKGNRSDWFEVFADLDPMQNPDLLGKSKEEEEERTC